MVVLSFSNVFKSFGNKGVLHDASFKISMGERVGLIGENGTGKSTILKLITGRLEQDAGEVCLTDKLEIGYLPQSFNGNEAQTIEAYIVESQKTIREMAQRMDELTGLMAEETSLDQTLDEYGELSSRFEARGGYDLAYKTDLVLNGLGIAHISKSRMLSTLSGGQKARVGLAALLISSPDLLLLDEPTNHLDASALEWLESYLNTYQGAVIIVSHDRQFLNQSITRMIEIDKQTQNLKEYAGNFDFYLHKQKQERKKWEEDYALQQEQLKDLKQQTKEAHRNVGHNRAPKDSNKNAYKKAGERVQTTISRKVRKAEKEIERIQHNKIPAPPKPIDLHVDFHFEGIHNEQILKLSNIGKLNRADWILENVNLEMHSKSRIVIVGPNGSGKSTLLNIIAGELAFDQGSRFISPKIQIGYLKQEDNYHQMDKTVLDYYTEHFTGFLEDHITNILSSGLFDYEELHLKVGQLSPGQFRKLQIIKMMASEPNMLLVDEPTNHLSIEVMAHLEQAMGDFIGPIVVVTHDRWLINRFQGERYILEGGKLIWDH